MRSLSVHLHAHATGHYRLTASIWEDGHEPVHLLDEESHPMPELTLSDVWTACQAMVGEQLRAREPGPGLWAPDHAEDRTG